VTDKERAGRIIEELRSRPGLYLELLRQMTDAGEVLTPWEPLEDGTAWVRRDMGQVVSAWGSKEANVISKVDGSRGHYFAEVWDPDERRMRQVESGVGEYGSAAHCFGTLAEAMLHADSLAMRHGYLLPPSREDAVMGEWGLPGRHPWTSLQAFRAGRGCPGVAMVFLGRPAPGEAPYEVLVDGEPVGDSYISEREAMAAADEELRGRGYVLS
jgi:hypothetical protein